KRIPLTSKDAKGRINFSKWGLTHLNEVLTKYNKEFVNLKNHVKASIIIMVVCRSPLIIIERNPRPLRPSQTRRGYTSLSYINTLIKGLLPKYKD
ncbi:hypothetical protein BKA67DRAFT_677476, partial [Truncatella angustata]